MSAIDGKSHGAWADFRQRLGETTQVPTEEITPDAQLVASLGLDSLALAELVIALREAYESPGHQIQLEGRNWQTVTVGQLFEDCTGDRVPART